MTDTITYDDDAVIIIDSGSEYTRLGVSQFQAPQIIKRTVVGKFKQRSSIVRTNASNFLVGEEALIKHSILNLRYPVENGMLSDWDTLEVFLFHFFFYIYIFIYLFII